MVPTTFAKIPGDTAKAARSLYGRSHFYLVVGDQANSLFAEIFLEDPSERAQTPGRQALLYLITIFQYLETMPDRLAVNAVSERVDWKYAMHLPLAPPRIDPQALCDFRRLCISDQTVAGHIQTLMLRLSEREEFDCKFLQGIRTDQVILRICTISRLSDVWETFNLTLEALATRHPDWLLATSLPHWYERFSPHRRGIDLMVDDLSLADLALELGGDGLYLLEAVTQSGRVDLSEMDEIQALRKLWGEQFRTMSDGILWRGEGCAGCRHIDESKWIVQAINPGG